ncbi:MAG: bacteriohemerythrin [Alphaproteobacteria bacterium]|nr:bacteriohemerythrin [Alphaproteobacteria bacterium]
MPLATWRDSMNLNYAPLDDEHRAFLDVVNQAFMASQVDDFQMIEKVFEKCYDYARNHFSHEEDIMERIQFPDIENHMRSHQVFIHNVSEMRQQFDVAPSIDEKRKLSRKLANFLNVWLLGHIMSRDKAFKPYLTRLRNLPPRMNF